jgi:hypothetical protein
MEKDKLKVFAAIPSIVCGKEHTIRHIIRGVSIVIPFHSECGEFVIDVCLQSQLNKKAEKTVSRECEADVASDFNTGKVDVLNYNVAYVPPPVIKSLMQEKIDKDLGKSAPLDFQNIGEKVAHLKKMLAEANNNRDLIMKELKEKPFMEQQLRASYKKALPAYEAKIKRLKLDIVAADTIAKMSQDDFENPKLKMDFQHYAKK